MDDFRCQVLSLAHVHSTGSVTVFFNGIFKREVRTRLAGILKARSSDQRVQERQLCAALATNLDATVCIRGLWPN
jgi:hypothetical protein